MCLSDVNESVKNTERSVEVNESENKGIGTCECFSQSVDVLVRCEYVCEKHSHVPIPLVLHVSVRTRDPRL